MSETAEEHIAKSVARFDRFLSLISELDQSKRSELIDLFWTDRRETFARGLDEGAKIGLLAVAKS